MFVEKADGDAEFAAGGFGQCPYAAALGGVVAGGDEGGAGFVREGGIGLRRFRRSR